ncbi:SGNH/GDSL hydrolase family protein [Nocardioides solisilvae]|uniref:SGNH/GDSL hydrolase family protein n=1 Tax=Nocardioides solisilvae TaxID=1542435 RepID=UPI0013A57DBE|nr:SGNH/GDSL hydrolase family protein [Nocardioides solisilvae]
MRRTSRQPARPRRYAAAAASLLATLALAVGTAAPATAVPVGPRQPVEPYQGKAGARTVAVIGDSITYNAHSALHQYLDPRFRVAVHGWPGATIADQQATANDLARRSLKPSIVVIHLGTNDANTPGDAASTTLAKARADLDRMIATFPSASCFVLTTVNAQTLVAKINTWADQFNFWALFDLQNKNSKVRLAHWNNAVKDYYAADAPYGPITTDTVHPNWLGSDLLAKKTLEAVSSCPAG